ncbi:hypothetical protein Fcan01_14654 [Folsomia candida]|uniref:Uncharacterized protein n=1 Tax=Folsomia candida TaxID=158441 RepID=A0A226DZY5_FOLCA|nr:hypothetical protein Fcan01_14654 [Folsomia candida]
MNCQTFRETYFLLLLLILNLTLISSSYSSSRASKKYFQVANDWYETTYQSTTPSPPPSQSESTSTPRILFPPGISLEFQPTLTIPFINKDAFGIGSSFKVSFPVTILLDKLSLNSWNDIKDLETEIVLWDNNKNGFVKARKKRSNNSTTQENFSLCRKLSLQKLALFKKLETFASSVSNSWAWNSRVAMTGEDCLLRTICEIYYFPITEEFGVFGDLLRELVRADRFPTRECANGNNDILTKVVKVLFIIDIVFNIT